MLILCYHAIADLSGDPVLGEYGIDPESFADQLDSLRARGFSFVGPDSLLSLLAGGADAPGNAVLLTFDDCYAELPDIARDILQPRRIEAIAFAVTGMASRTNEWDQAIGARRLRLLDGAGLQQLAARGVEIGCHSRTHRPMTDIPAERLPDETAAAADDLAALGLPRPRFFAYPHGQHDERSRSAVRESHFEAAFALSPERVTASSDRFAVPRVEILASDAGWRFRLKTAWPPVSRLFQVTPLRQRLRSKVAAWLRRTGVTRIGFSRANSAD